MLKLVKGKFAGVVRIAFTVGFGFSVEFDGLVMVNDPQGGWLCRKIP